MQTQDVAWGRRFPLGEIIEAEMGSLHHVPQRIACPSTTRVVTK